MGSSGGLTPDNIGVEYAGVVYAIAESPREKGLIWAGTNDGLVHLTRDGGTTWTNVTKQIPNLPVWGSVRSIAPSRYDAGTAYLTVDLHQVNNRDPFVYMTTDYGRTWRSITSGLPRNNLSYAKVIHEDPVRRGLLYLGLENAIFVSFDDGEHWVPLQNDLPHAPVSGIVVQPHFNDLVISTYGRGFWIMDDITPLQQLTPQVLSAESHLFTVRPAYRFRPITAPSTPYDDQTVGENPRYGASINYYLASAPAGPVTITIHDAQGTVVRTLAGTKRAGVNRAHWDLRGEPTAELRLRTAPLYQPRNAPGPDGRAANLGRLSLLMPPGTYSVKLSVGGREHSQPLEVRKDPHSGGTEADIEAQMRLLQNVRRDLGTGVAAVNQIESVRSQLDAFSRVFEDADVRKATAALGQALIDLEMPLYDVRLTPTGQDGVRYGARLLSKLNYLANGLASNDFRPTDQQVEVQRILADELRGHLARLDEVLARDVAAFNELVRSKHVGTIVVRPRR